MSFVYESENERDNDKRSFRPDTAGDAARNVVSKDLGDKLDAILTELGGTAGTPFHDQDQRVSTPGSEQTTISFSVPASTTRTLTKVVVSSLQRVTFRVLVNSVEVGSGRVTAGNPNACFEWKPGFAALTTQTVEVKVLQTGGPASDVDSYLMATDT